MLPGGADLELNGVRYWLAQEDDSVRDPYLWYLESLYGSEERTGGDVQESPNKALRFFVRDTFRGGSGQKFYDDEHPSRYWKGNANPRGFPGSIGPPPTRTQEHAPTLTAGPADYIMQGVNPAKIVAAGGKLWAFGIQQAYYSSDEGATWTENTAVESLVDANAANYITAVGSDGKYPWFYYNEQGSGEDFVYYCDSTTTVAQAIDFTNDDPMERGLVKMATCLGYMFGLAMEDDTNKTANLYAWSIQECVDGGAYTFNENNDRVYFLGSEVPIADLDDDAAYADLVAGDDAVYFFASPAGATVTIHEYTPQLTQVGAGRPLWTPAPGFTAQKLCHHMGKLLAAGTFNGLCALYILDVESNIPAFAGFIGEGDAVTNVRCMSSSTGTEVLIGCDDGTTSYVYVYDIALDAFSTLDSFTIAAEEALTDCIAIGARRLAVGLTDGESALVINSWNTDKAASTRSWTYEDVAYDWGRPFEGKTLFGFHVVQDPTVASGTITVEYQLDEDGVWISAGATTAGEKHRYLKVADATLASPTTKTFRTLRFRLTGANGARCLSFSPRVYVNTYQQMFQLKIAAVHMDGEKRSVGDKLGQGQIRRTLKTLAKNQTVVTLKDGRDYPNVDDDTIDVGYTLYDVVVEDPVDRSDSEAEGYFQVSLRSVSVT